MSNLIDHARRELDTMKLFSKDGDFYGGMTGKAVMELVEVFDKQGHSGASAGLVIDIFARVADFKALSPITNDPREWHRVADDPNAMWQNRRQSDCFSLDGGKTYYQLERDKRRWVFKLVPWQYLRYVPRKYQYKFHTAVEYELSEVTK